MVLGRASFDGCVRVLTQPISQVRIHRLPCRDPDTCCGWAGPCLTRRLGLPEPHPGAAAASVWRGG